MKKISVIILLFCLLANISDAQNPSDCKNVTTTQLKKILKIGIVISSNDPETVWNAFRLANYSLGEGDTVSVFLIGKGVEASKISTKEYDVKEMMEKFSDSGGKILACGTCLRSRGTEGSKLCPISSLSELLDIIKTNDRLLTF